MISFLKENCAVNEKICKKKNMQQGNLVKKFLNVYFRCLNEKILVGILHKAHQQLESTYVKASQEGYLLIVEKKVLDEVMGGKEELEDLMVTSGILGKGDNSPQMQIVTQGEGLLSILQENHNINLPLKTYYVQAHLYDNYIQLTLHQVVKIASSNDEEGASTIIVQDRMIPVEDIYDSLCKCMLENIESDDVDISLVTFGNLHQENRTKGLFQRGTLCSLECYTKCLTSLKKRLREAIVSLCQLLVLLLTQNI
jgi:hypothetical protein